MSTISTIYQMVVGTFFAYLNSMNLYWKKTDKIIISILAIVSFVLTNIVSFDFNCSNKNKVQITIVSRAHGVDGSHLPFALRPYNGNSKTITREMLNISSNESKKTISAAHKVISAVESRVDFEDLKNPNAIRAVNAGYSEPLAASSVPANNIYSNRSSRSSSPVTRNISGQIARGREGIRTSGEGQRANRMLRHQNMSNFQNYRNQYNKRQNYDYSNDYYTRMDHSGYQDLEKESVDNLTSSINSGMSSALKEARSNYDQSNYYAGQSNKTFNTSILTMSSGIGLIMYGIKAEKYWVVAIGMGLVSSGILKMEDGKGLGSGLGNQAGDYSHMADLILEAGKNTSMESADYIKTRLDERTMAANNYSRHSYTNYDRGDPRNKISTMRSSNMDHLDPYVSGISSSRRGRSPTVSTTYSRSGQR